MAKFGHRGEAGKAVASHMVLNNESAPPLPAQCAGSCSSGWATWPRWFASGTTRSATSRLVADPRCVGRPFPLPGAGI